MDVLIKNMEMPKSCYSDEFKYCPFLFFDYDTKSHCELSDDIRCTKTKRPKDCPLIFLPEHGDLIDRQAVLSYFETGYLMGANMNYEDIDAIVRNPKAIPTVLEANT